MFCDWLTMILPVNTPELRDLVARLALNKDVIVKLRAGEIVSESFVSERLRSDTHRPCVGLTRNNITIAGSPARLLGDNNVFGVLDIRYCGELLRRWACNEYSAVLPALDAWKVTRVDLTQNYDCETALNVTRSLQSLAKVAGGHLKVATFRDSTIYYNKTSDLWGAKAYAKGPHLEKMIRDKKAAASPLERELAKSILRLEASLRNKFLRDFRIGWDQLTEDYCMTQFRDIVERIVPPNCAELSSDQQLVDAIRAAYPKRKANQLCGMWMSIRHVGLETARLSVSRPTWFRYQADFKALGLSLGDLAEGTILPFRPRQIVARPVDSWADFKRAA